MKNIFIPIFFLLTAIVNSVFCDWNSPENGNPLVPGYFADPSAFYDSLSETFYLFSTTDGLWISFSSDPAVYSSKDFVHWKLTPLTLPSSWQKKPLWAPSIVKHPLSGKYYLLYAIGDGTYIASSSSPLGPWTNATVSSSPLYRSGDMWGANDWFDAQFFVDTATVYMTFGGGGKCGIAKIVFDADGRASIDNGDARMTDGSTHKFKQLSGLSNYLEGSCMFKKDGMYFLTYSNSACQNYNVRYAVASSPVGPFTASSKIILQRSNAEHILGPGHNSILEYKGSRYIVYHRQHYPYVDVKRQVCIDQITISGGEISAGAQSQEGVRKGTGPLESLLSANAKTDIDAAFGKPVAASSESDYKGGTSGNIKENFPSVKNCYAGRYALDRNNGTRWAPGSLPGYLIVDLGDDYRIGRCETIFEYVLRLYNYKIEYLANAEAASLEAAQSSGEWHMFADRSKNAENVSPVIDSGLADARFVKITVFSASLPTAQSEVRTIIETDYADRVSIVEFRVFEAAPSAIFKNPPDPDSNGGLTRRGAAPTVAPLTIVNASGRIVAHSYISNQQGRNSINLLLKKQASPPGIYFYTTGSSVALHILVY